MHQSILNNTPLIKEDVMLKDFFYLRERTNGRTSSPTLLVRFQFGGDGKWQPNWVKTVGIKTSILEVSKFL